MAAFRQPKQFGVQPAKQPFSRKQSASAPGAANYPRSIVSPTNPSVPSVTDDEDNMMQQRKMAARRFGIHSPGSAPKAPKI